jgi:hypothetical protein
VISGQNSGSNLVDEFILLLAKNCNWTARLYRNKKIIRLERRLDGAENDGHRGRSTADVWKLRLLLTVLCSIFTEKPDGLFFPRKIFMF